MNTVKALLKHLDTALDDRGNTWLDTARQQLETLEGDLDTIANRLVFYIGSAARKLGNAGISGALASGYPVDDFGECDQVFLNHWTVTDAARIVFMIEVMDKNCFDRDAFVQLCYQYSDEAERCSLLKGLTLMQLSEQSTEFIVDAARTNSRSLFSALLYKNPWPAVNFSSSAFNQIVLKSLFLGLDISQLTGLRAKKNQELGRMTADYVQERIDAERPVPNSIWLVVDAAMLGEAAINAWQDQLQSDDEYTQLLAMTACEWEPALLAFHH